MKEKQTFRIGHLAKELAVEQSAIRYWEKEFGISGKRSSGGQRFYTSEDKELFSTIKHLLYERRLTIEGARQELNEKQIKVKKHTAPARTYTHSADAPMSVEMLSFLSNLRQQLMRLKEDLS